MNGGGNCYVVRIGCAAPPLMPYSTDTPPLVLAPASAAGVQDQRARFREIYCAVLEARGRELPDYRPCEDALTRVGTEPASTGKPVDLGPSKRRLVAAVVPRHRLRMLRTVAAIRPAPSRSTCASSGTTRCCSRSMRYRARRTMRARSATRSSPCRRTQARRASCSSATRRALPTSSRRSSRIRRSGAASRRWSASQARSAARRSRTTPSSTRPTCCGTFPARPAVRAMAVAWRACGLRRARQWLARNPLPRELRYYSLVTFPQPERISVDSHLELRQAGPHRRAQRQPDDLL